MTANFKKNINIKTYLYVFLIQSVVHNYNLFMDDQSIIFILEIKQSPKRRDCKEYIGTLMCEISIKFQDINIKLTY